MMFNLFATVLVWNSRIINLRRFQFGMILRLICDGSSLE